jgi:hypothetical protein
MGSSMASVLERAIAAIDALHAEDPAKLELGSELVPSELAYARRMSEALARLEPSPSIALSLAVRAQHLCRWRIARSEFPPGKAGYLRWRREEAKMHAELASKALRAAGIDEPTIERVCDLVRKKDLVKDPETQTLEDAACLVFLEHHLEDFARDRSRDQLVDILQKTWRKMSERGRDAALALELTEPAKALLREALARG